MALKEYKVKLEGGVETTMLLSTEDAKRYDATEVKAKQAVAPANKAGTASNK